MHFRNLSIALLALIPLPLLASLQFENTELQIESDLLDTELEAVFVFTNSGDKPVTITELRSSCGCTVPSLDKNTYAPGESGEIRALFSFGGRTGKQHKTVALRTDDPENPEIRLGFSTTIPDWCVITPRLLRWTLSAEAKPLEISLKLEDPERITIEVDNSGLENFEISKVANSAGLQVLSIIPKTSESRVTEKLKISMTARDGDVVESRDAFVYCLIR